MKERKAELERQRGALSAAIDAMHVKLCERMRTTTFTEASNRYMQITSFLSDSGYIDKYKALQSYVQTSPEWLENVKLFKELYDLCEENERVSELLNAYGVVEEDLCRKN